MNSAYAFLSWDSVINVSPRFNGLNEVIKTCFSELELEDGYVKHAPRTYELQIPPLRMDKSQDSRTYAGCSRKVARIFAAEGCGKGGGSDAEDPNDVMKRQQANLDPRPGYQIGTGALIIYFGWKYKDSFCETHQHPPGRRHGDAGTR